MYFSDLKSILVFSHAHMKLRKTNFISTQKNFNLYMLLSGRVSVQK